VPETLLSFFFLDTDRPRSVPVVLNEETIVVRTHPLVQGHVSIAEFHY